MSERDELLERLLEGELAPDAPEVRERERTDPDFARAVREGLALVRSLDELGEGAREDLAPASDPAARAEEEAREAAFVASLRDRIDAERDDSGSSEAGSGPNEVVSAPPRSAAGSWRPLLLPAAAVLIALGLWLALGSGDRAGPRPGADTLGPPAGALEALAPRGEGADRTRFRWTPDPRAAWYEVRVFDPASEALLGPPAEVEAPAWEPDPARAAAWPDRIRWEVRALDGSGQVLGSAEADAER